MNSYTATQLASELNLTKGRISQFVSAGKLDGCFVGVGRARRFDLAKVAEALGRTLDQGQMMGNGSTTQEKIDEISAVDKPKPDRKKGAGATKLTDADTDRYKLARTLKAEEEARSMRRKNLQEEGNYVLASEVALQTGRLMAQEIAEFEGVLRDGARRIADELGVDFKTARSILIDLWRAHRKKREEKLSATSSVAKLSAEEKQENI